LIDQISPIYVLGHVNPDIDSIASAMGYAWLLREKDEKNAIAARPGPITPQTAWILQQLHLEPPLFLADASPRFSRIARPLPPVTPNRSLREAWAIAASNSIGVPVIDADNRPLGMVTGASVFKFISRQIDSLVDLNNVSVAKLLSVPCCEAMDADVPRFKNTMRISEGHRKVMHEERNDFLVTHDDGTYWGVCRSPDVINPPKMKIILVDHNEISQSIRAMDEAELVEVLDHHRLGTQTTRSPVPFYIDIVGSTSTLVSERIFLFAMTPPPEIAALLLSGVISDTLILKSPTTTPRDRIVVENLMSIVKSSGILPFKNYQDFGKELLTAGSGMVVASVDTIIQTDLKIYETAGFKFGLAQVEVGSLNELIARVGEILKGLEALCQSKDFSFAVLMVTDIVRSASRLLIEGEKEKLNDLPYVKLPDGTYDAPGLVSRKKQLLPAILALFE
jgi:manganese-dependent inorganic pyrophosphatase